MTKKLLGYVGVDSGQLIITDPTNIDTYWQKKEYQDIRIYRHKTLINKATKTKHIFMYEGPFMYTLPGHHAELFSNYEIKTSTGKSMNKMIEKNEVTEIESSLTKKLLGQFSYPGICQTTLKKKYQINYPKGHPGLAIAFQSGYGDGIYPIIGTFNKEQRCIKVEINCSPTKTQLKFIKTLTQNHAKI